MLRTTIILLSLTTLVGCSSSSFYSGKAEDGVYSTVYAPNYSESTGTPENTAADPYTGEDDYVTSPYAEPSQNPYQPNYNYNYWDRLYFNLGPYYNPYGFNPGFGTGYMSPYDPYYSGGWNNGWNTNLGWNSWSGWNAGFGYGMGWGMSPWGMNPYMNPYNNPYMSPWAMNSWGNPYWMQSNPYWKNWGYGFNDGPNNFYYGPRTGMTSGNGTQSGSLVRNRIIDEVAPPYLSPERVPNYRARTSPTEINSPSIPQQRSPQETENERGSFWNSFIPGQNTTPRERTPNTNERSPRVKPPSGTSPNQRTPRYSPPSNNTPRQRTPNYSPPSNNTPRQRSGGGSNNSRRRP